MWRGRKNVDAITCLRALYCTRLVEEGSNNCQAGSFFVTENFYLEKTCCVLGIRNVPPTEEVPETKVELPRGLIIAFEERRLKGLKIAQNLNRLDDGIALFGAHELVNQLCMQSCRSK